MSATFDTNLLLYASDRQSPRQAAAAGFIDSVTGGPEIVYLLWPVVLGYLRIATHPAVFADPLTPADAVANVSSVLRRPAVRTVGETDRFWATFLDVAQEVAPRGNLVPDAHIATLMLSHGIRVIWTSDRDFRKFDGIRVRDPFG